MYNKNNSEEPIIVLGFGRSGTTWISDIISKSVGGLILFEPFHPEVFPLAKECCYHNGTDDSLLQSTKLQIEQTFNKENKNKWLIRNHLSTHLDDVSTDFSNDVWNNCNIIGYKSIRQNFLAPWLYKNISKKIVFVQRDLLSVISSLLKRKQFWKEFGFDFHEKKFLKEIFHLDTYPYLQKQALINLYDSLEDDFLRMTFIWVITHEIIKRDFEKLNLPIFQYNDFYENPYASTLKVLNYLGYDNINLHPSYLFTPSMLTLRTFHKGVNGNGLNGIKFWEDTLKESQVDQILKLEYDILKLVDITSYVTKE